MFPKYSEVALTKPEYQACKQLAKGCVYADESEKLSKLGMIVDNGKICNFKKFKLVFQKPDVRHVRVYDQNDQGVGEIFLKSYSIRVTKY